MQRADQSVSMPLTPSRNPCPSSTSHVPLDSAIAALLIEPLRNLKGLRIYLRNSMNDMVRLLDASNVCLP